MAITKYLATQMEEDWGYGRCCLWNPPFDALPLAIRKIEVDGGNDIVIAPHWPAHSWYSRLRRLLSRFTIM